MRRAAALLFKLLRVGLALAAVAISSLAHAWKENTDGDLPWLGDGGRAHFYRQDSSSPFSASGYKTEQRWGRSSWSGEDPYITVNKAMGFLDARRGAGPRAGRGRRRQRLCGRQRGDPGPCAALPVHRGHDRTDRGDHELRPGRPDAGDEPAQGQIVGSARVNGWVRYGTRVPATGTLLWFSPEAKQAPTPVAGQATGAG